MEKTKNKIINTDPENDSINNYFRFLLCLEFT